MQPQGNVEPRWLTQRRREISIATALIAVIALLALVGPPLLTIAAIEWKTGRRRRRLLGLALTLGLARASVWLWRDLHGVPHGRWHPCAQCGRPIDQPSRASYCSHACRTYARLIRDAQAVDPRIAERAQWRLHRLRADADAKQAWDAVPF